MNVNKQEVMKLRLYIKFAKKSTNFSRFEVDMAVKIQVDVFWILNW
jgi:hypothetical protein